MPAPSTLPIPSVPPTPVTRTLFVVDWDDAGAQDLQAQLDAGPGRLSDAAPARPSWQVLNCPTTAVQAGAAGGGWARVAQAGRYLRTALQAAWRSRGFDQVVVWRQSIGYLLCALPRAEAGPARPRYA